MNWWMPLVLVCVLGSGAVRAQDPAWLPEFEHRLATGGNTALEFLRAQPLGVRKSADHEWALVRTYQVLNQPEAAGMALVTYDILTRRKGRDVGALRAWLSVQSQQLFAQAKVALDRHDDATASRLFLHAAICDQALLKSPGDGLRDETGTQLAKMVHNHPEKAEWWALLAGYHFHVGHLQAAREAMLHYLKHDLDEYQRWRGAVWLSSVDHALEKHRKLADQMMAEVAAEAAASPSAPEPEPSPAPAPSVSPEQKLEARLDRHRRLVDLDGRIRDEESNLRDLQDRRRGRVYVGPGGHVGVVAENQRAVKADIESAETRLTELRAERDALE